MKRIILSYPASIENELEKVNELLTDNEIDFFHLRKLDFDYTQMKDYLAKIDDDLHNKIIIHSHYSLITDFDLAGINLNRKALNQLVYADEVDKCFIQPLVLNNRQIEVNRELPNMVTYSAHSFEEVNNLVFDVDYAFLSPIYDSISKQNYKSNFTDKNKLKQELIKTNTKVIALGGVTDGKVNELKDLGFDGVAQLGNYWENILNEKHNFSNLA